MSERECAGNRVSGWQEAHEGLLQLAQERSGLDGREGRALLRALRSGVHVHLGHGSFAEYVERLFGYSPRTTFDKLRTAEALEALPELDHALTRGELSWSAARELARVATAVTEREWLCASKGQTVRDIERLVAGHDRGDLPGDPARSIATRHVLRFEVTAETLATFRQAMVELRRRSGEHLEHDTALLLMARHVLGGRNPADRPSGADTGRASYQLALTLCERCGRGFQDADGERLEVDAAVVEMVRCDAQQIGRVGGKPVCSPTATSCTATPSDVTPSDVTFLDVTPSHVGEPQTRVAHRAAQTIPPALRRHILCRDQGRCVVPGCRHTIFVDLHHIEPRSEGGRHDADNLVVLCSAHHRAVHRGRLGITGGGSMGVRVAHADGTPYGHAPSPASIALLEQVFRGLRGLGFKEQEARRALDGAWGELSAKEGEATAQDLLRAALRRLGPRASTTVSSAPCHDHHDRAARV